MGRADDRLTVVGAAPNGNGNGGSMAGFLVNANEQFKAATGVDVARAVRERSGQSAQPGAAEYEGLSSPRAGSPFLPAKD